MWENHYQTFKMTGFLIFVNIAQPLVAAVGHRGLCFQSASMILTVIICVLRF